jgi:hypothetical protein
MSNREPAPRTLFFGCGSAALRLSGSTARPTRPLPKELQKNLKIIADNFWLCVKRLIMKIKWAAETTAQSVGVSGGNE